MTEIAAIILLLLSSATDAQHNLIKNGDFEGSFSDNGIAEGWVNNSYSFRGDYDIIFSPCKENPYQGRSCQRITCSGIGYISSKRVGHISFGAVQMSSTPSMPLEERQVHGVSAWLRGNVRTPVKVQLCQTKAPWESYCEKSIILTEQWEKISYL